MNTHHQRNRQPVFITDCAALCACGATDSLLPGLQRPPSEVLALSEHWLIDRAAYFGEVMAPLPATSTLASDTKTNRMLLSVAREMHRSIERLQNQYDRSRIAVVIGTTTTGIRELECARRGDGEIRFHDHQELAAPAEFIADHFDLRGPVIAVSTACTSGSRALGLARRLLAGGWCDAVIAGAGESVCRMVARGFESLELLSGGLSIPFQAGRDGINIGEAAALFVLECAVSNSATAIALSGYGESNDAYHDSAPHPAGVGAEKAIIAALSDADTPPAGIDYINLHGTGTPLNDAMEAKVIARVFGERVAASSTKAVTGHTLGASGALEAAVCVQLLRAAESDDDVLLPPHHGHDRYDPALPEINLVMPGTRVNRPTNTALSTSYAFGGHNTALVLQRIN